MGVLPRVFCNLGSICPQPTTTTTSIHLPEQQTLTPHRRSALLLLSLPAAVTAFFSIPSPAAAFSISITGPKDWLRDQKKKAARFVLAPIESSRQSLRNAYLLLDSESPVENAGEFRKALKLAARDCVPRDRNSFVTFQATTGVEQVCTFALIVKNAASLLDVSDPLKLEAETKLHHLIRCSAGVLLYIWISYSVLGAIALHALPVLYEQHENQVDQFIKNLLTRLQHQYQNLDECMLSKIRSMKTK